MKNYVYVVNKKSLEITIIYLNNITINIFVYIFTNIYNKIDLQINKRTTRELKTY